MKGLVSFRRSNAALAVAFLAGVLTVAGSADRSRHDGSRWNLLLITLDTTRADRLGAYGFAGAGTPNIDRIARDGVLFEQAESAAPLTLPSHATLLTGRLPPEHGVRDNGTVLNPAEPTVAQVLQGHGFRTGAFAAAYVLDARWGLDRGFDRYDGTFAFRGAGQPDGMRRSADQIADRALGWLDAVSDARFFAWVHFYDAHTPYAPTPHGGAGYQDEIAFVDHQIGRLLAFLQARRLDDRTLLVVVGDHGESLGEHGERAHGLFVYEAVTRVPLIIAAPSSRLQGRRVASVVRTVDVMPTVLDLLGIPLPSGLSGVSLASEMAGSTRDRELDAYAESMYPQRHFGWSALRSLRSGRFKLIDAPHPELYDLADDAAERDNLYDRRPALSAALAARLRAHERWPGTERGGAAVDGETAAALASLGYVSSVSSGIPPMANLPDPKDEIGLYQLITGDRRRLETPKR